MGVREEIENNYSEHIARMIKTIVAKQYRYIRCTQTEPTIVFVSYPMYGLFGRHNGAPGEMKVLTIHGMRVCPADNLQHDEVYVAGDLH